MKHSPHNHADELMIVPVILLAGGLVAVMLLFSGCATYRFGPQTLYTPQVRTVHVPVFQSDSFRPHLGERLTEAVVKQIERQTPYKVVNRDRADSILTGRLVGDTKRVAVETLTDESRNIELGMQVQVSWLSQTGDVILTTRSVPVPAELYQVTGASSVVPEVGHSIATGQQQAIQRLAEEIVSLMEVPW